MALLDALAKLATVATPIVVALASLYVARSVNRIQVGPDFVDLALEIVGQDPIRQPEGLRRWAASLLEEYSGKDLDPDLRRRIEEGWSFTVPTDFVGSVAGRAGVPSTLQIEGLALQVRFARGEAGEVLREVVLSLPAAGKQVEVRELREGQVLRLHHRNRSYLLRLREIQRAGDVAEFEVWKQAPFGNVAE